MPALCNENMQVSFSMSSPGGGTYGGDQGIDTVKIKPALISACKAGGAGICCGTLSLVFSAGANACPFTIPGHTFVSGGGSIAPTLGSVVVENQVPLSEGWVGS